MTAPTQTIRRPIPTLEQREAMYLANVRNVLLEDGCDPALIESAVDDYLDEVAPLELPTLEELAQMVAQP